MTRWLKVIFSMLGLIILFALISVVLIMTFISPNRFKPIVAEQISKHTGRQVMIDGDLSWTFFPVLGVKVGHMSLRNPSEFTQPIFAEINNGVLSVKLLPLLHAQIESDGIVLKGMKLNLIKNAKGRTNWQDFQKKSAGVVVARTPREEIEKNKFGLAVSSLDISDASITWVDEKTKKTLVINGFSLHAMNINLERPFPVSMAFDFTLTKPAVSGRVSLESQVVFKMNDEIITFKDALVSGRINNVDFSLQGNVIANLDKESVQWDSFVGQIYNLKLNGKLSANNLDDDPSITGRFDINPFDLKIWLEKIGQRTDDIQEMKEASGDVTLSFKNSKFNMQSKLKIDSVKTSKVKMSDVSVEILFKDNIAHLAPLTAKLYQGDLYSQSKIDLNGTSPHFSVQANLSNVQAEPLINDLGGANNKVKLSGICNVEMQVTTAGTDSKTLLRNLNGSGNLKFAEGVLTGVDVGYLIDSTYALIKQQSNTATNSNKTSFGSLTATLNIHDGVVSNNDLNFDAPRFNTLGKGTIDLPSQQIDYSLQVFVKKKSSSDKDGLMNFYGMPVPIHVGGSLENPAPRLNVDEILKAVAGKQFERVKVHVDEKIKDQLKEKAGDLLNNFLGH